MSIDSIIKIAAVGDICPGEHPLCSGYGIKFIIDREGDDFLLKHVYEMLKDNHIVFGNLEGFITEEHDSDITQESFMFRGDPKFANILRSAGFNLLNLANNHTINDDNVMLEGTIKYLNNLNINVVGVKSGDLLCMPFIQNINNIKIGFLGYSLIYDYIANNNKIMASDNINVIIDEIKILKNEVNILFLSIHWGLELIDRPSMQTMILARKFIDAGANIILGHHPHVFQKIEKYNGGLIFYSLGNFLGDQIWWPASRKSAIINIDITRDELINYTLTPVHINKKYQAIPSFNKKGNYIKQDVIEEFNSEINYKMAEMYNLQYYSDVKKAHWENQLCKINYLLRNILKINTSTYKYLIRKIYS